MGYYDIPPDERKKLYAQMEKNISDGFSSDNSDAIRLYAADHDTYIRKNCYLILGRLYKSATKKRQNQILSVLDTFSQSNDEKIRQTSVYALGEIGIFNFDTIRDRLTAFINDTHHSVKNGLTGAIKKMGEKNPQPVFAWIKSHLNMCNSDMQKRILHGLELRGRTHPEELFPILRDVVHKNMDNKLKKMIIHIVGQISYKKGCLKKVATELAGWDNTSLVTECCNEIITVHNNYARFCTYNVIDAELILARTIFNK